MTDKIFPDANKGQQSLCSCVIFVGIVTLYPPYRLDAEIMDWILKYGDRMMSKIRFQMQTNLKGVCLSVCLSVIIMFVRVIILYGFFQQILR